MKDPRGDSTVLYLGLINVSIAVETLYIVLQHVTWGGNWRQTYLSVLILTTSFEFILS